MDFKICKAQTAMWINRSAAVLHPSEIVSILDFEACFITTNDFSFSSVNVLEKYDLVCNNCLQRLSALWENKSQNSNFTAMFGWMAMTVVIKDQQRKPQTDDFHFNLSI